MTCIWCLKTKKGPQPKAHIFPESIFGEHEDLVLTKGEVCGDCNHRFSHLESAFKDRLGVIPMLVGLGKNKRGRPTTVNVPGMRGTSDPMDPRICVNLGKHPWVTEQGLHVRPAPRVGERVEYARAGQRSDGLREFRLTQQMRVDQVFIRVLTKIAFEKICTVRGADYCADVRWHQLRAFVLKSQGERVFAMPKEMIMPRGTNGWAQVPVSISAVPWQTSYGAIWVEEWVAIVQIGMNFMIDMSPHNLLLSVLLDGPLRNAREAVVVNSCKGKSSPITEGERLLLDASDLRAP